MLASVKLNKISMICFYLVQITVHIVEMVSGINNLLKDTVHFLEEKASELKSLNFRLVVLRVWKGVNTTWWRWK